MTYLFAVGASLLLLIAFVGFSYVETKTGVRFLGGMRRKLDRQVTRASYVATHIDWAGFFHHLAKSNAERVAHDLVHTTLLVVRATERTLTRLIRTLRERVARHEPSGEPVEGSQLIATIVRFRKNLKRDKTQ